MNKLINDPIQTRYFKNASVTVNGLTCYPLALNTSGTLKAESYAGGNYVGCTVACDVAVRHSDGTETVIGSKVAQVSVADGAYRELHSNTWACPQTSLASSDSIVVRVYAKFGTTWYLIGASVFTTEQLGGSQLDSATWTFYYYLGFTYNSATKRGSVEFDFDGVCPSRIENFSWTTGGIQVTRTVTDYLASLDSKGRVANLYRSKIDCVGMLDTKIRISNIFRVFAEQLGLFDIKMKGLLKIINEQLGMLDKKIKILSKVMKDYVGLSDIKSRVASLYRMFSENLGIIDKEIKTLNKNIIEHVALFDSKVKSLSRTITENIKLLDVKMKTLSKNIVQYLGLDGFRYIGGQIVSRIVTEIVTFSDNIKKITSTWRKIRGYFIEDYERLKKKRLLRLLRHYILLESEDE